MFLIPLFRWPASLHRWCEDQQSSLLVQDGGVKASWALHSCHLTVWEEQHHPLHTESLCHLWLLPHTLHRSLQESVWEKSKCVLCGCVCVCVSVCVFVFIIYVWRITWLLLHSSITHNFYISKYKKKKKSPCIHHTEKKGKKKKSWNDQVSNITPYLFCQIVGEWKGASAGGCANNRDTYNKNPLYQVRLDNNSTDNHLMIELRGPK